MSEFTVELVYRLNQLLSGATEDVRKDIFRLISTRVPVSGATCDHGTIQVMPVITGQYVMGFMGLLNGILGGEIIYVRIDEAKREIVEFTTDPASKFIKGMAEGILKVEDERIMKLLVDGSDT
jgi:hypothetical protein